MSTSDYYEKVSDLHIRLDALIRALSEAQKIISRFPTDTGPLPGLIPNNIETFPGLIPSTPKDKQLELLQNAWIILDPIDNGGGFVSDIEDLIALLEEVGDCPVEPEPEFQGFEVGS